MHSQSNEDDSVFQQDNFTFGLTAAERKKNGLPLPESYKGEKY